jgi:hypothetical protein
MAKREKTIHICLAHRDVFRTDDECASHGETCKLLIPIREKDLPVFNGLIQEHPTIVLK